MPNEHQPTNNTGGQQPSHKAIDNGNPTIFKPKWLVLDSVNISLITYASLLTTLISTFYFKIPFKLSALPLGTLILPLRLFFPLPKTPEGRVLITGGSSGIGAELAYIFVSKGHEVILVGRNEEQLSAVKQNIESKYDGKAYTITSDLSVSGAAKRLYEEVHEKGLQVDILVNGAGLGGAGETFSQSIDLAERMTMLNCVSLVQLTQLFGGDMIKREKGWIMQISSVGGTFPRLLSTLDIHLKPTIQHQGFC
jgi:NADPH:quinone reductase-like Zn-dependent oxidoreductase